MTIEIAIPTAQPIIFEFILGVLTPQTIIFEINLGDLTPQTTIIGIILGDLTPQTIYQWRKIAFNPSYHTTPQFYYLQNLYENNTLQARQRATVTTAQRP